LAGQQGSQQTDTLALLLEKFTLLEAQNKEDKEAAQAAATEAHAEAWLEAERARTELLELQRANAQSQATSAAAIASLTTTLLQQSEQIDALKIRFKVLYYLNVCS
jgi:hypothetical protein